MTARPIIFSAPMVLALLSGRKTMTRRLAWRGKKAADGDGFYPSPWQRVEVGDRLWVRESHWRFGRWNGTKKAGNPSYSFEPLREPSDLPDVVPAADASPDFAATPGKFGDAAPDWHLRPSIFMLREHSRLTLVVTGKKIERLRGISEGDAAAEGIVEIERSLTRYGRMNGYGLEGSPPDDASSTRVNAFASLWRSLHGIESWEQNPEVVAISFKVIEANLDEVSPGSTHIGRMAR